MGFTSGLIITLFTLILGVIVSHLGSNLIKRMVRISRTEKVIKKTFQTNFSLETVLADLTKLTGYLITLGIILQQNGLNIQKSFLWMSGVILVLILLSFKDIVPNLIVGIILMLRGNIKINDMIEVSGIKGKIKEITLLETRIMTSKKELISVPNINLFKNLK